MYVFLCMCSNGIVFIVVSIPFDIQFDCGVHPALSGIDSLPYFDEIDLSTVDLCLISQWVGFVAFSITSIQKIIMRGFGGGILSREIIFIQIIK